MSLRDWAKYINDNRVGPILRELADALEECEDEKTIQRATRAAQDMGNSARSMLYYRKKENRSHVGKLGDDNGG